MKPYPQELIGKVDYGIKTLSGHQEKLLGLGQHFASQRRPGDDTHGSLRCRYQFVKIELPGAILVERRTLYCFLFFKQFFYRDELRLLPWRRCSRRRRQARPVRNISPLPMTVSIHRSGSFSDQAYRGFIIGSRSKTLPSTDLEARGFNGMESLRPCLASSG